ncbi:MAG: hypothetical protein AAFN78_15185, partial [Pseudomonadota bacterium]
SPWNTSQYERNVITWFSSVQLVLVGVVAYGNFELTGVLRRVGAVAGRRWIWLLFGCAFVFLAIDERFEFHEFVRDQLLRPADVADDLPGIRSGDITMYVYLAVGLVAAGFLVEALRRNPTALVLFGSAVMLSVAFTLVDTLEHDITAEWIWPRFWTSAFEETAEIWAQGLFALSFLAVFRTDLQSLREQGAAS